MIKILIHNESKHRHISVVVPLSVRAAPKTPSGFVVTFLPSDEVQNIFVVCRDGSKLHDT